MSERSFSPASATALGDRRDQILRAAGRLFSQKGYHGTSMRDLAAALGLTQGSLYHHWAGKEELLFAIIDRISDEFLKVIEPIAQSAASPTEKLRAAARAHIRIIVENLDTATVFLHEWKFLNPEYKERVRAKRDRYEALFREILAEGIRQGEFRLQPADVRYASLFCLSALNWIYQWYSPRGELTAEEIADRYVDLLLRGLRR